MARGRYQENEEGLIFEVRNTDRGTVLTKQAKRADQPHSVTRAFGARLGTICAIGCHNHSAISVSKISQVSITS